MKHIHSLIVALILSSASVHALAGSWSYSWSSADRGDETTYYKNFATSFDPDLTSMSRSFNGKEWTLDFPAGTKLTTLSGCQAVGAPGAYAAWFDLSSSDFSGTITSVSIEIYSKISDAVLSASVGGKSYLTEGALSVPLTTESVIYTFTPGNDGSAEGDVKFHIEQAGANQVTYISSITVEWSDEVSFVVPPVISPESGSYDEPFQVTISAAEGASIRYTTDGSNPRLADNSAASEYAGPFSIEETTTVKACAIVNDQSSAVTEAEYTVRVSPQLAWYNKDSFVIELLEEDMILVDNPHNVPLKYSSSDSSIAWVDSHGVIYTYKTGEATLSVIFDGDATYLPQTITAPLKVVAKEPLAPLVVTPDEGSYTGEISVTATCSDPRAQAIWYYIGDRPAVFDDLGLIDYDDMTICPETTLNIIVDKTCYLTVQAVGDNVWSEPKILHYEILPGVSALRAAIGAPEEAYLSPEVSLFVPLDYDLTFSDDTEGDPDSWLWTLPGAEPATATTPGVTVRYPTEGTYEISLEVSNSKDVAEVTLSGVKAGGRAPVWNIPVAHRSDLAPIDLAWFGNYAGSNWLDMNAFAEYYGAPAVKSSVSAVNVYFASVSSVSPDAIINVSIAFPNPDVNTIEPGEPLATASLPVSRLQDASGSLNTPTVFTFDTPVVVESDFFVVIDGFPNRTVAGKSDAIAVYALRRTDGICTAFHRLPSETVPGLEIWYKQVDDPTSLAIAPVVAFDNGESATPRPKTAVYTSETEYFNLQGVPIRKENLRPGIYIVRRGESVVKEIVK